VFPVSQKALLLEPHNLIVTALKKAEDDDSMILRFYEAEGNRFDARIRLACPIQTAHRTNLVEEIESKIPVTSDGSVELAVGPWEIVTVRLKV